MTRSLITSFMLALFVSKVAGQDIDTSAWYYIQFLNGGAVITAQGDNANVRTATPDNSDDQFWKVSGNQTDGYAFVSRSGLKLNVSSTSKNGMMRASSKTSTLFRLKKCTLSGYTSGYLLYPKSNSGVYANQWGGAGVNKEVGLWDAVDANCPLRLVSEEDYYAETHPEPALSLIPKPVSLKRGQGSIDANTPVTYAEDQTLDKEEYRLSVGDDGITIASSGDKGRINAEQTLRQLRLLQGDGTVPCVTISDKPRFGYRGLMLDISRHFFGKEAVKRLLDVMALYHFSILHWHLTDDQGWRVEIPEYPKLTEIGAVRKSSFTVPSSPTTFYDDTEYGRGMYYTLDDLREVVAYAAERGIEIIPEYDLPGHNVAAVASYPNLLASTATPFEGGREFEVRVNGGISKDVLNVGKPEVMDFLKCVLGHLAEVFPSQYIHLGGDECPVNAWQNCKDVQNLIKREGLADVHAVQPWLLEQLGLWLKDNYGKTVVCWDELLSHWPSTNTVKPVIMAWNSLGHTQTAANHGFQSICVPYQTLYLDFMQAMPEDCYFDEPYYGGWSETNVNTLPEIYSLNPTSSTNQPELVLGPQGNLWTETCTTVEEMEHCYFPRALALSEVGWTAQSGRNWTDFLGRMQNHARVLNSLGVHYATHYFEQLQPTDSLERERLLSKSKPGEVGHVSEADYNRLLSAPSGQLNDAIREFKDAPIIMPTEDTYYEIRSASRYYKAHYNGSTLYGSSNELRIHYTPQFNPDELWTFTPVSTSGKYKVKNSLGKNLYAGNLTLEKATVANSKTDYEPGVVNIQYSLASTKKNYFANQNGTVTLQTSNDDTRMIGYPGSWTVIEIKDHRKHLSKLLRSLTKIDADILSFGEDLVSRGDVTKAEYDLFLMIHTTGTVPQELRDLAMGIEQPSSPSGSAVSGQAYNLSGQPVTADYSGVIIVNGKKVLMR